MDDKTLGMLNAQRDLLSKLIIHKNECETLANKMKSLEGDIFKLKITYQGNENGIIINPKGIREGNIRDFFYEYFARILTLVHDQQQKFDDL